MQLGSSEIGCITQLLKEVTSSFECIEDPELLKASRTYAEELPWSLRASLNAFRLQEPEPACLISGFPVDDAKIGRTPEHWKDKPVPSPTFEEEVFFQLCASLLGDTIGWSTQQDGYVMHDVLPVRGQEQEQLGSGSEVTLTWHTEDAFHPYRADYIGLMCLRNPDDVGTTYAALDWAEVPDDLLPALFEPHFTIRPDESHLPKNRSGNERDLGASPDLLQRSYARMERMNSTPERIPILWGDPDDPYARLDPYFMDPPQDPRARGALQCLVEEIDRRMNRVALEPGQIVILDNHRCVHGREPFKARYDGSDRWLKRLNIARDLRRSRDARIGPDDRVIF